MGVAAKSNVNKRQVGCLIVDSNFKVLAEGYNYTPEAELHDVMAPPDIHAEAMACEQLVANAVEYEGPLTAYVTHPPCPHCAKLMADHGIVTVEVVEAFMKFDGDKLRYDLIPPSTTKALAEVLTFGARKYKPNNWKNVSQEELYRYRGAAMRHFEAYRAGEWLDPESGMPHLWHCMTNISFLIELEKCEI